MDRNASQILKALGKSEAINLLRTLDNSDKGLGFNQLKKELKTDAKTLTRRLDELGELELTEKSADSNYHITSRGRRVLELSREIKNEIKNNRRTNVA